MTFVVLFSVELALLFLCLVVFNSPGFHCFLQTSLHLLLLLLLSLLLLLLSFLLLLLLLLLLTVIRVPLYEYNGFPAYKLKKI